ncbi:MAG: transaldolase [SAR324 cluster bacterium]|nr:transaldolase [SAR324 cluster bacterium]
MKIKIFSDGANINEMLDINKNPIISGFTTNPSLMYKAGIPNYKVFSQHVLKEINDKPISFEIFADDIDEMERQAREIATWGSNVYVKIPVTNTKKISCASLIKKLSAEGVQLNITAILSLEQVSEVADALKNGSSSFVSVFAGRIADTGVDPVPLMKRALEILKPVSNAELLWASPREVLNVYQAESIGCHIITATNDILKKLDLKGKDLEEYSLETVQMFFDDAQQAGYRL